MKKQLICSIALMAVLLQNGASTLAQTSPALKVAIRKYKAGNFTGCLQDCQNIIQKNPSNSVAHYYMAISYVQAGKKDEAIKSYTKVLSLKPNSTLSDYAKTGKRCLETPDKCNLEVDKKQELSDIDRLISSPYYSSPAARKEIEQKHLDSIRSEINGGQELDDYRFNKLNSIEDKTNIIAVKPSDEEIEKATRILNDAGIKTYKEDSTLSATKNAVQNQASTVDMNQYTQMMNQSPEMAELNMLMGNNSQYGNNNNSMMNMLPLMMMQNKDGAANYSPQLMQAVMMNSMMPDLNYNLDKDK